MQNEVILELLLNLEAMSRGRSRHSLILLKKHYYFLARRDPNQSCAPDTAQGPSALPTSVRHHTREPNACEKAKSPGISKVDRIYRCAPALNCWGGTQDAPRAGAPRAAPYPPEHPGRLLAMLKTSMTTNLQTHFIQMTEKKKKSLRTNMAICCWESLTG